MKLTSILSVLLESLQIGTVIQVAMFMIALLSIAVTVGYFKGVFEGMKKDIEEMKSEKKKELTDQTSRNSKYDNQLAILDVKLTHLATNYDTLVKALDEIKRLLLQKS